MEGDDYSMGSEGIAALLLAVAAGGIDLRRGIIPNRLVVPGFIVGLAWHLARAGGEGLVFALGGAILASALFVVPFLWGGIGGGDLKLLLAVGAFWGPWNGFRAALAAAITGGIVAAAVLLLRTKTGRPEGQAGPTHDSGNAQPLGKKHKWGTIRYGPVIAVGVAWAVFSS